ncbi:MAG TPA: hypothetical protein VK875_01780 [Euzebyales bacterium]|nr:hypothetical protein [Euzebyales bacterium]
MTATLDSTVRAFNATGGIGRTLLSTVFVLVAIVVSTVAVMAGIATGSLLVAMAIASPLFGFVVLMTGGRLARWRAARDRRRLRRRVGDPVALGGDWRRLLAAAWIARDEFAAAVTLDASSPIAQRLAGQQLVMDAALERCGDLARRGHRLTSQLRAFRPRRLRRELLLEYRRDRNGVRAVALQRQLDDVDRLRDDLRGVRVQLEEQLHNMRTAAWRASTLPTHAVDEPDAAMDELLDDLAHLRAALAEVERPPRRTAVAS